MIVFTSSNTVLSFLIYMPRGTVKYHIGTNYCTVHLGFSKLLGKLVVKYVSTYTKGTLKKKKSVKDLSNEAYAMFLCVFSVYESIYYGYSFE